jgi:hypothetical protein
MMWLPAPLVLQEPGVVKIYYASDKPFMVNGKELLGYVLVYFDVSDVRAVLTHRLQERKVISIDFRRDIERSRELWSKVVNELSKLYNGSLRGSIRLPTLGVTLMLFDGEGYMYTYTWTFSAFKYNLLVKGMRNHTEAFIEALKNPFEFIERGLVLVLDPARFTLANFSIVDINRALKHVKSLVGERGDISETAVITASSRGLEELSTTSPPDRFQDIYWYDLYNSRYDPPSWYRSRLTARSGQIDDPVSHSWYVFAWRFSMATNYAKDKYSFRDAFELFFNYDFYFYCSWPNYRSASGDYVYTMLSPDDFVEICLTGYQVDASWSHTYPPNSLHQVYKPYVIFYRSTKNLTFEITYVIFEVNVKKGLAFFNVLILGREDHSASYFEIVAGYSYKFDSPSGYYGGGFIIPAVFLYSGDRVLVTWLPTTRYISGREYWSFIPYPVFIPYHEEVSEDLDNAIGVHLDSSNMIARCTCATIIGTSSRCSSVNYYCSDLLGRHIWDLIDRLSYQAVGLYESIWSDCSISTRAFENVIDSTNDPRITVRDPAIVFNIIKDFVVASFGLARDPATKLIGAMLSAFSLVDLEFRAEFRDFVLMAERDYDPCTGEYIVIKKNTYQYALQRGLIPLVAYYYVTDYYPETPPEPIPQP